MTTLQPAISLQRGMQEHGQNIVSEEMAVPGPKNLPDGSRKSVCCIGAGYVGGSTCTVMANKVPDVDFLVVDIDSRRINAWNSDDLPIFEPGLEAMVRTARDGINCTRKPNLYFSTEVDRSIQLSDIILISVNTPTKLAGLGAGKACDLKYVESAARKIAEVSTTDKIVVEKSTVPCRTADSVREILRVNGRSNVRFDVLSNPEFLAEGTAISDLLKPDRVLVGSIAGEGMAAANALVDLYARWVPREKLVTMNLWSSELAKIAANCMLAQRISSINSLSAVCEATGASIKEVSHAIGLDQRIGSKMLRSSVGFGGSCFKKDVLSLAYLAETLHLPEVANYWTSVVEINEWQKKRFAKRIIDRLHNTLVNKKVAIFGFAYKKDTGDTRESAAFTIVRSLLAEGAQLTIYDPQVSERQILQDLKTYVQSRDLLDVEDMVRVCPTPYEACAGVHAVVILTEWDEFRTSRADSVDWQRLASGMVRPAFVFDGRNVVEANKLERLGLRVESIGNADSALYLGSEAL
ncbi:MAG: UDP-glucose 6-dehydrogenase 1 [Chrysothrix sp. TS-e1954]|nr:MAG: UDP-glucose 6-dehydrogenase 1 [Chrysothrix sp. TS-e1954]